MLYRDNESVLPLVDLLERSRIPYRIRNADPGFFTSRVVTDIRNILLFAEHPEDTELFLQIYYKLSGYLTKKMALAAAGESAKNGTEPLSAVGRIRGLPAYVYSGCRELRTHFQRIRKESASDALVRVRRQMGYDEYLKRSGISNRSLWILEMLARQESSASSFLNRLDELRDVIRDKPDDPACPFILSTVHSSKGLEYEQVYLLDAVKGIFPEEVPEVTRARRKLTLFRMPNESPFTGEFLKGIPGQKDGKAEAPGAARGGRGRSASPARKDRSYEEFQAALAEGLIVTHRKFGEGFVKELGGEFITIVFDDCGEKKFLLRTLYDRDLLRE